MTGEEQARLDALDALFQSLAEGRSPAEAQRERLPGSWAPVLARCAVAGTFDVPTFGEVLDPTHDGAFDASAVDDPGPVPPTLGALQAAGVLDPVPGRPGWYAVPEDARPVWSAQVPDDDLVTLHRRLAEEHLRHGHTLDGLRHLLAADPVDGLRLFEELFADADRELDLPLCQDLLRAAHDAGSPDAAVASEIADHQTYFNARSLWLADVSQSAKFLAPPGLTEAADDLRDGRVRVWEVSGQGGVGKTMQLRWLISRRWVPRPAAMACALVDLDTLDPMTIARYPFLVLVLVADQLAHQLPRNPFSALLRSYGSMLDVARWAGQAAEIDRRQARAAATEVPAMFIDGLATGSRSTVVVLDTLEELTQLCPAQAAELVDLLARVAGAVPELRLVFSGRFTVPHVRERFPDAVALPVVPFDDEQATVYLRRVRGIADRSRCDEITRRAHGLPFLLAMYADLVTCDPDVILDTLDAGQAPTLVYMVERVVDRISQPLVRWLLRYGAVARRLSRTYLLDVIAPFLLTAASGDTHLDDPMIDPITEWRGRRLFPTDLPDLREALEGAWDELSGYAGGTSWVMAAHDQPDTLVFKAEVRGPMREVLAGRPVWRELHRASARYYLQRARAGGIGERWVREALFHIAHGGDDLSSHWRSAIDEARDAGRYEAVRVLAGEITGTDYAGDDGQPLRRPDGSPLVRTELLVEAHLWSAYAAQAAASRQQASLDDPRWSEVERELALAEQLAGTRLQNWLDRAPAERQPTLENALELASCARYLSLPSRTAEADPTVLRCLTSSCPADPTPSPGSITWETGSRSPSRTAESDPAPSLGGATGSFALAAGWLGLTAAARRTGSYVTSEAVRGLRLIREIAERLGREDDVVEATLRLVDQWVEIGDFQMALDVVLPSRALPDCGGRIALRRLRLLLEAGLPDGALAEPLPEAGPTRLPAVRLRARALIAARRPVEALNAVDECLDTLTSGQTRSTPDRLYEQAECLQVRGVACGELLRLDEAVTAFEQASSLWRELGHPHGHVRSRREHAEVLLRQVGDVGETVRQLRALEPLLDNTWDSQQVRLLLAQAVSRTPEADQAGPTVREVLSLLPSEHHLRRAEACISGLIATRDVAAFGEELLAALDCVWSGRARARLVDELRWMEPLPAGNFGATLMNLTCRDEAAAGWRNLGLACVAHAVGENEQAQALATVGLRDHGPDFATWQAVRHLGGRFPAPIPPSDEFDWAGPTARAVVELCRAEQLTQHGSPSTQDGSPSNLDLAQDLANRAAHLLTEDGGRHRIGVHALHVQAELALAQGGTARAETLLDDARLSSTRLGDTVAVERWETQRRRLSQAPDTDEPGEQRPKDEFLVLPAHWGLVAPDTSRSHTTSAFALERMEAVRVAASRQPARRIRVESPDPSVLTLPWDHLGDGVYLTQPPTRSRSRDRVWARSLSDLVDSGLLDAAERETSGVGLLSQTRQALERAYRSWEGRRVAIVQASRNAQESWGYGHSRRGLDLARSYRRHGWVVARLAELGKLAGPSALSSELIRLRPSLIHLTGRLETSGSQVWFDLSNEDRESRARSKGLGARTFVSTSTLFRWLWPWLDEGDRAPCPPPVVVLDPVIPPTRHEAEAAAAAAARNRYAAEVYLDCPVLAVVALGLSDNPYDSQLAWLAANGAGASLLEAVQKLSRAVPGKVAPRLYAPSATLGLPER